MYGVIAVWSNPDMKTELTKSGSVEARDLRSETVADCMS
jgi:hypothetical protein